MGHRLPVIEAHLPEGAHRVVIDDAVLLAPRIVVSPHLPPGALAVTVDGVTLVPDTRVTRGSSRK